MSKAEYLVFLPLLFYGFALAELFREWKRLFRPKDLYLPYILITVMLTETAIYNVFIMTKLLDEMVDLNYSMYLLYLIPPFLFMLTVNVFTPDLGDKTDIYFQKNRFSFFLLIGLFILSHFLFEFHEPIGIVIGRIVIFGALLFIGISKKEWPIYLLAAMWLFFTIFRLSMQAF